MEQQLFDKIKDAAKEGNVIPSDAVWNKLEIRLDAKNTSVPPPSESVKLFSFRRWSIAASILVLIGAYGVLNHLGNRTSMKSTAIQLEDLHTLEVNPRYNVAPLGESSTIISIQIARSINATYEGINEGSADKKLMGRSKTKSEDLEYGLG